MISLHLKSKEGNILDPDECGVYQVSFMWNRHDQIIRKIIVGNDWVINFFLSTAKLGLMGRLPPSRWRGSGRAGAPDWAVTLWHVRSTGRRLYPSLQEILQCENCVIHTLRNSWGCGGFLFVLWYHLSSLWPMSRQQPPDSENVTARDHSNITQSRRVGGMGKMIIL